MELLQLIGSWALVGVSIGFGVAFGCRVGEAAVYRWERRNNGR